MPLPRGPSDQAGQRVHCAGAVFIAKTRRSEGRNFDGVAWVRASLAAQAINQLQALGPTCPENIQIKNACDWRQQTLGCRGYKQSYVQATSRSTREQRHPPRSQSPFGVENCVPQRSRPGTQPAVGKL